MADEPPQQAPESGADGEGAATTAASEAPSGARGLLTTYLPLIIAVVVMPALAWVTIELKSSKGKAASGEKPHDTEGAASTSHETEADASSHGAAASGHEAPSGHGAEAGAAVVPTPDNGELSIPVPLTRDPIKFVRKDLKVNPNDYDKIVALDVKSEARDLARADKIVVNIALTGGARFAVARFLVFGRDMRLIKALNEKKEKLLDEATGALSSKTLDDINKPGFRNFLRAELLTLFNQALYPHPYLIEEVIITEFVIQ
ncbi:MAG: flagellar basal body-associated FliL family protein [Verrucomicrobia bacterium]|nr:flagellar basal body-associated FliL family protein [Verrucomicrobiota bacterium]